MRPLRLDMAGFTIFRQPTTIDFTDADFFALVGPTGSGKSTVLDAICFALYGTVPRWGGTRGIANALAPSAAEARVRLVFESAGARYVATRVVRRDGRGTVKTDNAGLQLMPAGFDVTKLDTGMTPEDLGEVLAGTPADMNDAVRAAIGLPYEQFTRCVVLPQGQFADLLHAKPAARQQMLVDLLGLGVYEEVQKRASVRATAAEAGLATVDGLLAELTDADDAALAAATERLATIEALVTAVETAVPELESAHRAAALAREQLAALDAELTDLAEVRIPPGLARAAAEAASARAAISAAQAAVVLAEEGEEKLRSRLEAAGDPGSVRLLLAAHAERDRVADEHAAVRGRLDAAEVARQRAAETREAARIAAEGADAALEAARRAYQEAQAADRAAALRAQLVAGEPCPVCTQQVATVPPLPTGSGVAAAEAAGHAARSAADAAQRRLAEADTRLRSAEHDLARLRAQQEQLDDLLGKLDGQLVDSPGAAALRRDLAACTQLAAELDRAHTAVRTAREQLRRVQVEAQTTEERLRTLWRDFDDARDRLARFGPPAANRDDLAVAWQALADWAAGEAARRRDLRPARVSAVDAAQESIVAARRRIDDLFTAAGLPTDDDPRRAVAVALERATAARDRILDRRAQAERLRGQRAAHERQARVARALAGHLRANNFERWLLTEALDLLVDGASGILRELSDGQYELVHDKGEFFVVDHHDAGLRRGVRTLSGGETFQASLALALALSEQLAGLSTTSASLESIVLDEGFGTLDAGTLETVAATLENLAARGDRMVGVVTHVSSLAERVPVRFEVHRDRRGARVERIDR